MEEMMPYKTERLGFLKFVEENGMPTVQGKKTKGGIFHTLTIGGKIVLMSLIMADIDIKVRNENISKAKRDRTPPKNTLILAPDSDFDAWRNDFEIFVEQRNLRVLYLEKGELGKNMNFYSYEVVVSSYSNFNLPKNNRSLKGIEGHKWHRLFLDKVDNADIDTMKCILKLKVVNKWVLAQHGVGYDTEFLYRLLFGPPKKVTMSSRMEEMLQACKVRKRYFHGFGSTIIQTIPIELSHEEREPYMEAQTWVKEQFMATTGLVGGQKLKHLQYLELCILKLRDMASNLSLRLEKEGNIQEYPKAVKKLEDKPDDHCTMCRSSCMMIKIITICNHVYCEFCWYKWFNSEKRCAECRRDVNDDQIFSLPLDCPSSKANGLVEHLKIQKSESKSSMVIPSFERLLPWLETFLTEQGFSVQRITSEMSPEERVEVLQNPTKGVVFLANVELLISDKMDISAMDQIYLMEGMKESVENSLIAQLGIDTKRMFRAFRLIVEDSVEGRIVGMDERKTADFKEFTVDEIRRILT